MIPSPKLDDREFDDLVAEALRLIPRYAPEWTHHNPADPGITLIELAAWLTDLILYRVNKVPEKNYIAFLNLLGIMLKPPQAARCLLQFTLVEGASRQVVPAGIPVSTPQGSDEDRSRSRPRATWSSPRSRSTAASATTPAATATTRATCRRPRRVRRAAAARGWVEVFGGAERVDRFLYLTTLASPAPAKRRCCALPRLPGASGRDLARRSSAILER